MEEVTKHVREASWHLEIMGGLKTKTVQKELCPYVLNAVDQYCRQIRPTCRLVVVLAMKTTNSLWIKMTRRGLCEGSAKMRKKRGLQRII